MRNPVPTIALYSLFAVVSARGAHLHGTVYDPAGFTVADSTVRLTCGGKHHETRVDALGQFAFHGLPSVLACSLHVSSEGFSPFYSTVSHTTGEISVYLELAPLRQVVDVSSEPSEPPSIPSLGGVSLLDSELKHVSNSTGELIDFAKMMAGVTTGNDAVYVDGLPGGALPPAEMVARIDINQDPFAAEYADGGKTNINIVTKGADRAFRVGVSGASLGLGGRNALDPRAGSQSHSGTVRLRGAIPFTPATFAIQFGRGLLAIDQPIPAALPATITSTSATYGGMATMTSESETTLLNVHWAAPDKVRLHFALHQAQSEAENVGVGVITLPEAGQRSQVRSSDIRASMEATQDRLLYRGGLVLHKTGSDVQANSLQKGIVVAGALITGGAPFTSSQSRVNNWTWKSVVEGRSHRRWTVGGTISRVRDFSDRTPNPGGVYQFSTLDDYEAALAGQPTATLFTEKGIALVDYRRLEISPFVQGTVFQSERTLVNVGLRLDYWSGFGSLLSPRFSAATRWGGFTLRGGVGLFARDVPVAAMTRAIRGDALHQKRFIAKGVPLDLDLPVASVVPVSALDAQLDPGLTQPREGRIMASVERALGALTPGVEYSRSIDEHLLGIRRTQVAERWVDLTGANRSARRHGIRARLDYKVKGQHLLIHYEWILSHDNSDGLFSQSFQGDDLQTEWARSAGISKHNWDIIGDFKLPLGLSLTLANTWRGSAPYNITTGLDLVGNGLYNDRGGRARNSGNGPSFNSLSGQVHKRIAIPTPKWRAKIFVHVRVSSENLLNNKNYTSVGSVASAATFGKPLSALPRRSLRISISLD